MQTSEVIRALRSKDTRQVLMAARAAADMLEDRDERLAMITEGRDLVDRHELSMQLLLISATAGGVNGERMLEMVERIVEGLKGV